VLRSNDQQPTWRDWLIFLKERLAILHADHASANSASLADLCARDYAIPRARIGVAHIGVDTNVFAPRVDAEARSETTTVLFSGRLEPRKGVLQLVRAFALASRDNPRLRLLLVGSDTRLGPGQTSYAEHLRTEAAALGVADHLEWLGPQPYDRLPDLYRSADLLVAPSRYEAFGMVVIEAMACGTPVIASPHGGPSEIVADGSTGFLVEPSQTSLLAARIGELASDSELRRTIGSRARAQAVERFSLAAFAARALHSYELAKVGRGLLHPAALAMAGEVGSA
jgi:glycosyltransferase involved in cell wall biosynthesis